MRLRMHLDGKQNKEQYKEQDKEQQDGMPRRQLFRMAAAAVVGLGLFETPPALVYSDVCGRSELVMSHIRVLQHILTGDVAHRCAAGRACFGCAAVEGGTHDAGQGDSEGSQTAH